MTRELEPVMTYNIILNMNQVPGSLVTRKEEWEECLPHLDGLFGPFNNCADGSMTLGRAKKLISWFEGKKNVLVTNWDIWNGRGDPGPRISHKNIRENYQEKWGFGHDELFVFDRHGKFLSVEQLDQVRDAGWPPVMINCRNWGPKGDGGREWEEEMKASMAHPWCSGVVVEGTPQVFHKPPPRVNERLQVAQYAAKLGKPVYFLTPPCWPADNEHGTHVEMCRKMVKCLHETLDGLTYPGQVTIVPALYQTRGRDSGLEALPARGEDGKPANTFTGGILVLCQHKAKHGGE